MLVRTYALGLSAQGRNGLHDTVKQLVQKSNIQRQVREARADLQESLSMNKVEITCNKQSLLILTGDVMWKAFQTTRPGCRPLMVAGLCRCLALSYFSPITVLQLKSV